MIKLCMDTSHRYLVLALYEDDCLLAGYSEYAWKKQSEIVFVKLNEIMKQAKLVPDDIDEVIITQGPGSYTGLRIAMSVAKVFCTQKNKKLFTISTLQLYAGKSDVSVILDARSNRVYYGKYANGIKIEESIKTLDEVKQLKENFVGDVALISQEAVPIDFIRHFNDLKNDYQEVKNIHLLTPVYLKEESDYLK